MFSVKRKIESFILFVLLPVCLCGCGSESEKYMKTADKYYVEGQYDYAAYNYVRVLETDRDNEKAYMNLIDSYIAQGKIDEAMEYLEDAERIFGEEDFMGKRNRIETLITEEKNGTVTKNEPTSAPEEVLMQEVTPTPELENKTISMPTINGYDEVLNRYEDKIVVEYDKSANKFYISAKEQMSQDCLSATILINDNGKRSFVITFRSVLEDWIFTDEIFVICTDATYSVEASSLNRGILTSGEKSEWINFTHNVPIIKDFESFVYSLQNSHEVLVRFSGEIFADFMLSESAKNHFLMMWDIYCALEEIPISTVSPEPTSTPVPTATSTPKPKKDSGKEAEEAISKLNTSYDKVLGVTWYYHKNRPEYADTRCYVMPIICQNATETYLKVEIYYTDKNWIFWENLIFYVDGINYYRFYDYSDIKRDNGGGSVWEELEIRIGEEDIEMLRAISASNESIVRFYGDDQYYDYIVEEEDKIAIKEVLDAYEYLK